MRSLFKAMRFLYGLRVRPDSAGVGEDWVSLEADPPKPGGAPAPWMHWVVPLGLAVGVLLAFLTAISWGRLAPRHGDGGTGMAVVPPLLFYWLGPGAARYLGWGRTFANLRLGRGAQSLFMGIGGPQRDSSLLGTPDNPSLERLAIMVMALLSAGLVQYVSFAVITPTAWPGGEGLSGLVKRLLFPRDLYGAIVLMGVWGNASVLLSASLGRPAADADRAVRELVAAPTWQKMVWGMAPGAGLLTMFLVGWRWRGEDLASTVALAAAHALAATVILFGTTMLFGWLLARGGRGHCRATLLASALIGEVAFLVLFHALVK